MGKFGDRWKKKEPEKAKIRAYVATPAYDGKVDTDYAISLAESCQYATAAGIHVTAAIMGNGAFIDLARCNFAHLFLKTDCTHLFFIDADLKWESRAFLGLLTSGRPICAGMYRRRQEPEEYPVRYIESEDGGLQVVDNGWIKCDRVPTGFLCIERRVIEEMAKDAKVIKEPSLGDVAQLFYTQLMPDGRYMGEDYSFCEDYVRKYGEPIYVWPDFDFVHGGYVGNWHKFLNQKALEYYAEQEAASG